MKKYFDEIVIFILQLVVFYVFPIFAVANDANGMLVIILLATFIASIALGGISKKRVKYYYPIIVAFLFIPAIYIYNTEFLLIDTMWCLISSTLGILTGDFIMRK